MNLSEHIAVPYLVETVAFLLTVVVIVPLFKRLKISPVLGYLAVGTLIGPHSLGIVNDVTGVQHFAELGVVFLLFAIGLELSFQRLKTFSRLIFGLGSAQVILSATAISGLALAWDNSPQASIIIGLCLALSSTAMVMQLLAEKGETASRYGRASFSILLFQDLAVVPILILLAALGGGSDDGSLLNNILFSLLRALLVISAIILFGRFVLRYLFRMVSRTHSIDVFTAMSLLVILATALLTGLAGLSMALGAFLAGILLAETEFRHQIEAEIEPFKGLLLGLFFMGVGMNLDLGLAFQRGIWVALSVIGLIAIKSVITTLLALLFRLRLSDALRTGLLLAESGEFAFVVIGQASLHYQLMDIEVAQFMVVVASISMATTPLLALIGKIVSQQVEKLSNNKQAPEELNEKTLHDHIVIAGYGRVGQTIAAILESQAQTYVAIDKDADRVRQCQKKHLPTLLGDATRFELLKRTGVKNAAALVITLDDATSAKQLVHIARQHCPELSIIVRARDNSHSEELKAAGANIVVPELLEASLQLSTYVLCVLGLTREEANAKLEKMRRDGYDQFKQSLNETGV